MRAVSKTKRAAKVYSDNTRRAGEFIGRIDPTGVQDFNELGQLQPLLPGFSEYFGSGERTFRVDTIRARINAVQSAKADLVQALHDLERAMVVCYGIDKG